MKECEFEFVQLTEEQNSTLECNVTYKVTLVVPIFHSVESRELAHERL
jgi:hypothetical protein